MKPLGLIAGAVLVVGLAFVSRPVVAYETGSKLLDACLVLEKANLVGAGSLSTTEHGDVIGCAKFVHGTVGGFIVAQVWQGFRLVCMPKGGAVKQGVRVVVKFLREHPERLHEDAAGLVMLALHEAFACK